MRERLAQLTCGILAGTCCVLFAMGTAAADEWEKSTPYYEDDAWYDVTEWFDGNDYNPTDEVAVRWDDETFEAWQDVGTDVDSDPGDDTSPTGFGYDELSGSDNWFYDYFDYDRGLYDVYDHDVEDQIFDVQHRFYDVDDDGLYDVMLSYEDEDKDGLYEDVDYVAFNPAGEEKAEEWEIRPPQAGSGEAISSRRFTIEGEIAKRKSVKARKRGAATSIEHLVISLKPEQGNSVTVDLGPKQRLQEMNLEDGREVTVSGPMAKIGERPILLARTVKAGGESVNLSPNRRAIRGTVADTRSVEVRGRTHLLVMLDTEEKKKKVAVDVGPQVDFREKPTAGDTIAVVGVPVKVEGKNILLAQSIQHRREDRRIVLGDASETDADREKGSPENGK